MATVLQVNLTEGDIYFKSKKDLQRSEITRLSIPAVVLEHHQDYNRIVSFLPTALIVCWLPSRAR